MSLLLEPFGYGYMTNAMWVSALVGGVCAFLSAYLMLKGWSLIGDALSHSVVPGVAGADLRTLTLDLRERLGSAAAVVKQSRTAASLRQYRNLRSPLASVWMQYKPGKRPGRRWTLPRPRPSACHWAHMASLKLSSPRAVT